MNLEWLKDCNPLALAETSAWGEGKTVSVLITSDSLLRAAQVLKDKGLFLDFMTALDVQEGFFLNYLFCSWKTPLRIVLRVQISHDDPRVPSLAGIHSGADWHERECRDFFGVLFVDHPNLDPLLLPPEMELRPLLKKSAQRKPLTAIMPLEQVVPASAGVQDRLFVATRTETA
ncbi:NADH-quinone oxidoreductase subunit C [Desulfonatronum thiodismutans]|uniref:NADH-quinone oxidoreductase subunit C n=1 Tax=Desulfonatronum thiodismutans TaxID=159290 RepID=UPI0006904B24|nr:NADH-quinone oxidoreductase subunit C [Desulfonatronum thiodismutans]